MDKRKNSFRYCGIGKKTYAFAVFLSLFSYVAFVFFFAFAFVSSFVFFFVSYLAGLAEFQENIALIFVSFS